MCMTVLFVSMCYICVPDAHRVGSPETVVVNFHEMPESEIKNFITYDIGDNMSFTRS